MMTFEMGKNKRTEMRLGREFELYFAERKKNVNLDFVLMFIHNSKAAYRPFSFVGFVFPIQIM